LEKRRGGGLSRLEGASLLSKELRNDPSLKEGKEEETRPGIYGLVRAEKQFPSICAGQRGEKKGTEAAPAHGSGFSTKREEGERKDDLSNLNHQEEAAPLS